MFGGGRTAALGSRECTGNAAAAEAAGEARRIRCPAAGARRNHGGTTRRRSLRLHQRFIRRPLASRGRTSAPNRRSSHSTSRWLYGPGLAARRGVSPTAVAAAPTSYEKKRDRAGGIGPLAPLPRPDGGSAQYPWAHQKYPALPSRRRQNRMPTRLSRTARVRHAPLVHSDFSARGTLSCLLSRMSFLQRRRVELK